MEIALYMMFSNDTTSVVYFIVIFVVAVAVVLGSWVVLYFVSHARGVKPFVMKLFTMLDIRFMVAGFGIVIVSIISFVVETNKTYFIWHSLWHVCVMLGAWLLLYSAKFKVEEGIYGNMAIFADTSPTSIPIGVSSEEDACDENDDSDENTHIIEAGKY